MGDLEQRSPVALDALLYNKPAIQEILSASTILSVASTGGRMLCWMRVALIPPLLKPLQTLTAREVGFGLEMLWHPNLRMEQRKMGC